MSAIILVARKNAITTGTSLKTLLQIKAPTNQRLRILEVAIGFHDTVNTDAPIQVDLVLQSTAGTMSALTLVPWGPTPAETFQSSAQHTATGEPTAGNVLMTWAIHPQTGLVYPMPPGKELIIPGGGYLGLVVTAATTTTADAYIRYEE